MKKPLVHRPTWVEIDLDAISYNIGQIKKHVGNRKMMGIVKADSYGHGSIEVARILIEQGVDYLAVAILDEAIVLRKAGITHPILILGYTPNEQIQELIQWDIIQTVYNRGSILALSQEGKKQNKVAKVHLKVDTGMGRIGLREKSDIIEIAKEIHELPFLQLDGIFTHFSVADQRNKEYTERQLSQFLSIIKGLESEHIPIPIKHCANSAAIIDLSQTYFDLVRPGIILYGLYPSDEVRKEIIQLKPAMSFKTRIAHIKDVPVDTSISYGRRFITSKPTRIATLPVGYADGYSRLLTGKAHVIVHGKRVPVVGAICMDQCMIDITEVPESKLGDEVILFGEGLPVEELAESLGTINYEIPCMINKRVPRVYIKNNSILKVKNILLDD